MKTYPQAARRWVADRHRQGVLDVETDRRRLELHVLPLLGRLAVAEVRPRHIITVVSRLREAGAAQVHLAITCPPITHPCFMGVDMGTYEELNAHQRSVAEICTSSGTSAGHTVLAAGASARSRLERGVPLAPLVFASRVADGPAPAESVSPNPNMTP